MSGSLSLLSFALAFGLPFACFTYLERAGRSAVVILAILGLLVVEVLLYQSQNQIGSGLFHPQVGGTTFRLVDVVIPSALAARFFGRRPLRRIDAISLWWIAFLVWLAASAVIGMRIHNDQTFVAYEAKAILYIGAFLLAAGVHPDEYLVHHRLERFLYGAGVLATAAVTLQRTHVRINANVRLLPLSDTGALAGDAGSVLGALGVLALALALYRRQHRLGLLLASAPLCYAALISGQRAAILGWGVSMATLVVLCATHGRRLKTTPTEIGLALLVTASLVALPPLIGTASSSQPLGVPLVGPVEAAFGGTANRLSEQSRVDQWESARTLIKKHSWENTAWFGDGLGTTYQFYDPGPQRFLRTNITHNIYLDLWLRAGIIGLALFLAAAMLTVYGGVLSWRRSADAFTAALALGTTSILVGLLAKGVVESLFEKYRLATFMGLVVGMVCSTLPAARRAESPEIVNQRAEAIQWS